MSEQSSRKRLSLLSSYILLSHLYNVHTYLHVHTHLQSHYSFRLEVSVTLLNLFARGFAQFPSHGQILQVHRVFTQIVASATSWSCSL